jgi:superfamily II DNA or RNA helicase
MNYHDFLNSKKLMPASMPIDHGGIHPALFPFQKKVAEFSLEKGRSALFLDTGLGKTITQCEWARHIPGEVLIVAPLAVASQTVKEAQNRLGMDVVYSKDGTVSSRVTITNYERLDKFDCRRFAGVVLDESSILKGFMGKTKQLLCDQFSDTRYRLACTATPAPNDHMELGNHSQFLGVMPSTEMLARWFINDPSKVGVYKIKGHAEADFWAWVGSWAACVSMPSDLGFEDGAYILPKLNTHTHTVNTPMQAGDEGELFMMPTSSATDLHKTKRLTLKERCGIAAELANSTNDASIVWCESNDESTLLAKLIPDAVEVKGSDSIDDKEDRMIAFSEGRARVLISKASICGFGMNFQHASHMVFASISYSYESFYQAIRREWRFGQTRPVNVHVVISDAELPVWRTIERKAGQHDQMKKAMVKAIMGGQGTSTKLAYQGRAVAQMPSWLQGRVA